MNKNYALALMVLIVLLWAYPVYDSVTNNVRDVRDLSKAGQWLTWVGTGCVLYLIYPLFLWVWVGLKRAFVWLKNWLDGK